jgi:hypothetical protein
MENIGSDASEVFRFILSSMGCGIEVETPLKAMCQGVAAELKRIARTKDDRIDIVDSHK